MHISKQANSIIRYTRALRYAVKDPRVSPWVKWMVTFVLMYILSPVDLIPDFIPVIGYLDELLLVPVAVWLVIRMMPAAVWQECLLRAEAN